MGIEGFVLGGNESLDQARRHRLDRHEDTFFRGMFGDQRAVASMNPGGNRRLIPSQLMIVRQPLAIGPENPQHPGTGANCAKEQQAEQHRHHAKEAQQQRPPALALLDVGQIDRLVVLAVAFALRHGSFRQRLGPYSTR